MPTIYLSGPMTGIPHFNFPLFDNAKRALQAFGWHVISPADHDRATCPGMEDAAGFTIGDVATFAQATGFDLRAALAWDVGQITEKCNAIAMLPGWTASSGARTELAAAIHADIDVYQLVPDERSSWGWRLSLDPYAHPVVIEEFGEKAIEHLEDWQEVYADQSQPQPMRRLPQFIGLMGYARAGKDTAAKVLVEEFGYTRVAFADPLREAVLRLNPFTASGFRLADIVSASGWEGAKTYPEVRRLLQVMGTEVGRELFGQDIWVDTAFRLANEIQGPIVFTDVRFPNELESITARNGTLVRIVRPNTAPVNGHASETALDGYRPDCVLVNDGTVEALQAQVRRMVHSWS